MVTEAVDEFMENVISRWSGEFDTMWNQAGESIKRRDACRRVERYMRGLLGSVERKNGWQMAEYVGENKPYNMQHTLDRAVWDADKIRDELRRYTASHLLAPANRGYWLLM